MAEVRSFMLIRLQPGAGDLLFVNIKVYCGLVAFNFFSNYEMLVYTFEPIVAFGKFALKAQIFFVV